MTNPLTILVFAAVFAGLGFGVGASFIDAAVITLSVWIGSALWWLLLTAGVAWLRDRLSATVYRWINRISGAALVVFGVLAMVSVLA